MESGNSAKMEELLNRPSERLEREDDPLLSQENESLDLEQGIEKASLLKTHGNTKYRQGTLFAKHTLGKNSMIEACTKYAFGLEVVKAMETKYPSAMSENQEFRDVALSLYLNLAAAGLALDSFESSLNCCNAALEIDPNHAKGFFRRAKVYTAQQNYEKSLEDLESAIRINPKSKELRSEYRRVKELEQKRLQKEAFRKETEEGMRRLELQKDKQDGTEVVEASRQDKPDQVASGKEKPKEAKAEVEEEESAESRTVTREWIEKLSLEPYIENGTVSDAYAWGQTLDSLHILVRVPLSTKSSQVECELHRKHVILKVRGVERFRHDLLYPITVDDSLWEIEEPGCIHILMQKEHGSREPSPGFEWWPTVFVGGPEIDVADCSVGTDLSGLPKRQQEEIEKLMWKEAQKTPEEKAAEAELYEARAQAAQELKRKEESAKKAMEDPKKKALFDMMKEKFPDIPVEFR